MADVILSEPLGMIALRGDLEDGPLRAAVQAVMGVAVPDRLRIEGTSAQGAAWMSPDELLLFVPRDEVVNSVSRLGEALAGTHHLVLDVSDLRACLCLDGPAAREVLAKLTPADLHPDAFGPGSFRRTRLGQVAAAIWLEGQGARVLCFRSLADYALALLRQSARDGAVGHF
jgi:sarcosine oxidase subunit gamma